MNNDRELSWNDAIENDGGYEPLPEGEYPFTVKLFERGRHTGSEKLPPCNKAVLTILVGNPTERTLEIKHNLFLHSKTEGMLCQFFRAIGARKSGERIVMDWNKVVGAKGRCIVKQKPGFKDATKIFCEIGRFLDPVEQPGAGFVQGEF
jgi:hypothetical protein